MRAASGGVDLLRHGATGLSGFRGSLDDPLSDEGWAQMRSAVREAGPWQAVLSSPLTRCAAFARELAARHGAPLELDARLAELHFGTWEGRSAEQLMQTQPAALARFWEDPWRHAPPGGETLDAFEARVLAAWREACATYAGRRVLVVTHGGVIRLLLCRVRGLPRSEFLRLEVPHASLHGIVPGERAAG